jgi:hypothetical protein
MRPAERALMAERISCFATPTRKDAEEHPGNWYHWMLAGAELYEQLEVTHPLLNETTVASEDPGVFETFPHAISCSLAGKTIPAKQKSKIRPRLLRSHGISTENLKGIDLVDAALCALTARYVAKGMFKTYGEAESG